MNGYVTCEVQIVRETEKAYCCIFQDDEEKEQVWVPKSQTRNLHEWSRPQDEGRWASLDIKRWFIQKKAIIVR